MKDGRLSHVNANCKINEQFSKRNHRACKDRFPYPNLTCFIPNCPVTAFAAATLNQSTNEQNAYRQCCPCCTKVTNEYTHAYTHWLSRWLFRTAFQIPQNLFRFAIKIPTSICRPLLLLTLPQKVAQLSVAPFYHFTRCPARG